MTLAEIAIPLQGFAQVSRKGAEPAKGVSLRFLRALRENIRHGFIRAGLIRVII